ncbi:DUF59 domain-containing protein [Candidatus Bathyarchaeota archaeon]|nr:MAG: DUF59 domain-containing protein [Candidatus Bathyarchaeota archaeon]
MTELEDKVYTGLGKIVDPETGLTFNQMKMIQSVKETKSGVIRIDFTPSSPFCPMAIKLALEIKNKAENVEGVNKALVYCHGHIMEQRINQMVNET